MLRLDVLTPQTYGNDDLQKRCQAAAFALYFSMAFPSLAQHLKRCTCLIAQIGARYDFFPLCSAPSVEPLRP